MVFKAGDKVTRKSVCCSADAGIVYTVISHEGVLRIGSDIKNNGCSCTKEWTLVDTANNYTNMNLKEKFALAFKGEPEKSFIKAGVMNIDETLTSDGQAIFLAYLLKKNGDDFKATVIDPILAEAADK